MGIGVNVDFSDICFYEISSYLAVYNCTNFNTKHNMRPVFYTDVKQLISYKCCAEENILT